MFNNRRQSRDSAVIADIAAECGGRIFCAGYSLPLFSGLGLEVRASQDFLSAAGEGGLCFVENLPFEEWKTAEKIIAYRWNRLYPGDLRCVPLPGESRLFRLAGRTEFPGTSHEKITKEVYEKCG